MKKYNNKTHRTVSTRSGCLDVIGQKRMNKPKSTWSTIWYGISTIFIMLIGGFWMAVIVGLLVGKGTVALSEVLQYASIITGILLVACIKYHKILRKICLPFLFIG